jgi:hypothetical protein
VGPVIQKHVVSGTAFDTFAQLVYMPFHLFQKLGPLRPDVDNGEDADDHDNGQTHRRD